MGVADFTLKLRDKWTKALGRAGKSTGAFQQQLRRANASMRTTSGLSPGLSRGFGGVSAAALGAKAAVLGAAAGLATFIGSAMKIAQVGSEFEQTQNQIAGTLTALGEAGNFQEGLKVAESTIRLIRRDSAALPGEAEDYISIFKAGLPVVQKSIGGTIGEMTAFTNRFAAITNSLGIDTEQAGNDLRRLLQVGRGGAGVDVRSFTQLLPFMQQVSGFADITAQSFNEMSEAARAQLLVKTFEQLQPMLDNASTSFDAMFGAMKSSAGELFRVTSKPLFEAMKSGLERVNTLFMDSQGELTPFAQQIVDMGKSFADFLVPAIESTFALIKEFGKGFGAAFDVGTLKDLGETIKATLASPEFIERMRSFGATVGGVATAAAFVLKWMVKLIEPILQVENAVIRAGVAFANWVAEAPAMASQLVDGLIGGINSMVGRFVGAMSNMASSGLSAFKSFFGISSPSRLMMEQAGFIGSGIERGIRDSIPGVQRTMDLLSTSTMGSFGAAANMNATMPTGVQGTSAQMDAIMPRAAMAAGGAPGGGGGGVTVGDINVTVTVGGSQASPQEIANMTAKEVRRQLNNVMESMAAA